MTIELPRRRRPDTSLLASHLTGVESLLAMYSVIAGNAGHTLHMGLPREAFIREFLEPHLGARFGIGSGEIINATSRTGQQRPQVDIVVYHADYPRVHYGGGVYGYFVESVDAIIEVKSTLDRRGLEQAIKTAQHIKALRRSVVNPETNLPRQPPIRTYVVAYGSKAKDMGTVHSWIAQVHEKQGLRYPAMPPQMSARHPLLLPNPSIDGVFVLGRGFVHFDSFAATIAWDN